jgi:hypothetical protein
VKYGYCGICHEYTSEGGVTVKRVEKTEVELVLVAHQRHRGGCLCGWNELGKSLPGHQAAMLREAGLLREDSTVEAKAKEA